MDFGVLICYGHSKYHIRLTIIENLGLMCIRSPFYRLPFIQLDGFSIELVLHFPAIDYVLVTFDDYMRLDCHMYEQSLKSHTFDGLNPLFEL